MTDPPIGSKQETEIATPYELWQKSEAIPVIKGYYIEDLKTVHLEPWPSKGGLGAFVNLTGTGDADDAYICEIPPGESLKPQKCMFEEVVFVLTGRGATNIWTDGGNKQTFEWQEGSIFSPPLNTWRQHFNGQGNKPVRFLVVTTAPLILNLFRSVDFAFNNNYVFKDRYDARRDYFSSEGKTLDMGMGKIWESNFIPDAYSFNLPDRPERGLGAKIIKFAMASNTLGVHISEFPIGMYKKAHRHGPGAHVVILSGEGYSLLWPEGKPKQKLDWHEGSMLVPPDFWFHQHFNTGNKPAKYMAVTWGNAKYGINYRVSMVRHSAALESAREGGNQIEYGDEEPEIREIFESELKRKGLESKMPRVKH